MSGPKKTKTPRLAGQGAFRKTHCAVDSTPPSRTLIDAISSKAKSVIVWAAVWGLLPVKLAEWIIRRLHLGAA